MRILRDLNAAINILGQGLPEVKPVEMEALAVGNDSETIVREAGNAHKQVMGYKCTHYRAFISCINQGPIYRR